MLYLLDTNACIRLINGTSVTVRQRLELTSRSDVCVCSVVKAELFYGAMKSRNPGQTFIRYREFLEPFASLSFDDESAIAYGQSHANNRDPSLRVAPLRMTRRLVNGLVIVDWEVEA